jgi:hypothetical protein
MADSDIVQTIKVEVEGGDEAADDLKKIGESASTAFEETEQAAKTAGLSIEQFGKLSEKTQAAYIELSQRVQAESQGMVDATQSVQQAASQAGSGTQGLGKGLDDVSQKSGVSTREMRGLSKIMKEFGAGELAGTAFTFYKIASALGPLGVAVFALAEGFAFLKGKMKEAEAAAKAVTQTMANLAKTSAEMHAEQDAEFWGTQAKFMKAAANDAGRVADQFMNIARGIKQVINPLTSAKTETEAFIIVLERSGISVNDVMADTKKLGEAAFQASLQAADLYKNMSPIEKLNFEHVLKSLGFTDEQIKSIEKGRDALQQARAEAEASSWENWAPAFRKIGEAITSAATAAGEFFKSIGAAVAAFAADFGKRLIDAVNLSLEQGAAAIKAFVTTPVEGAWQWVKDAWAATLNWIAEKWAAFKAKVGLGGGGSTSTPEPASSNAGGGLLGGRGSGTSDSNLAWVSRGEHIMPAHAVSQPGVLAFLEALRLSGGNLRAALHGMGRFALGGLVLPAFAGGGMNNVSIHFPGLPEITGLRASSAVVSELQRAAALAQVRSGGRKPSRYR